MGMINIGKKVLSAAYAVHKSFPVRDNRVCILSRQANTPSTDILLLRDALLELDPSLDIRILCKTLDAGVIRKMGYLLHMIGPQMHALATSRVAVLDSYCIAASILHHRSSLKIVQMWHALGAFKRFGKSILDQREGTDAAFAAEMNMHAQYDVLLASSEACVPCFAEAFGYPPDQFRVIPLPRTDLLRSRAFMQEKAEQIRSAVPEIIGKQVILFAPTFRKGKEQVQVKELARAVQKRDGYALVLAPHPHMQTKDVPADVICDRRFSSLEWLSVCDAFVTDYSAMVFDAAVADQLVYLYAPDKDDYLDARGFYLDYEKDMPTPPVQTAEEIMRAIERKACTREAVTAFQEKYVRKGDHCAQELAAMITDLMR